MDTITVVYPLYCTYYIRNNKRYFTAHGAQVIVVCPIAFFALLLSSASIDFLNVPGCSVFCWKIYS